mmetsp:Transcript_130926/g.310500  ORF Transcript_130926/g.310500 Transcript_130926/m.310500 type:complete len:214 (+) Transcript_130926:1284-1925(+)
MLLRQLQAQPQQALGELLMRQSIRTARQLCKKPVRREAPLLCLGAQGLGGLGCAALGDGLASRPRGLESRIVLLHKAICLSVELGQLLLGLHQRALGCLDLLGLLRQRCLHLREGRGRLQDRLLHPLQDSARSGKLLQVLALRRQQLGGRVRDLRALGLHRLQLGGGGFEDGRRLPTLLGLQVGGLLGRLHLGELLLGVVHLAPQLLNLRPLR